MTGTLTDDAGRAVTVTPTAGADLLDASPLYDLALVGMTAVVIDSTHLTANLARQVRAFASTIRADES